MKTSLIYFGMVLNFIFFISCNEDDQIENHSLAGTWKFIISEDTDSQNSEDDLIPNCYDVPIAEISFSAPNIDGSGTYSGSVWSNPFSGNYSVQGQKLIQ